MTPPLEHVRVLELTSFLSGPFGGMILGDLGAEVIKVEGPEYPDDARQVPPHFVGDNSLYYLSLNRNKKSLALDLKSKRGQEVFLRLVEESDVLLNNFKPGVMERLGLDYDTLREVNPRLVYCSLSGFGQTGPDRDRPGYDYLMQALSGVMSLTGDPDDPPTKAGISIVDHVAGMFAALSITTALTERDRTGTGREIDLSLLDSQVSLLTYLAANYLNTGETPERVPDSGHPYIVPAQNFETADGYLSVMAMKDEFFADMCEVLDHPEWAEDPRFRTRPARLEHKAELIPKLKEAFRRRSTAEWVEALQDAGVPCAPVNTLDEALENEQVRARDMVVEFEHPEYGEVQAVGNPLKYSQYDPGYDPAPLLGEHTRYVLEDVIGLSRERVRALEEEGIVASPSGGC